MIKKITILSLALTMLFSVNAFAQEVTNPNEVIKVETFTTTEDALAREFHNSEIWRSDNYIKYLDGVIYNLNETVRIKKEIVNNYEYLSKYNSYYATLIPQAQADLEQAKAWVEVYKVYKAESEKLLKAKYY